MPEQGAAEATAGPVFNRCDTDPTPSLRAERIPLQQIPIVDFEPFRLGGQTDRKRAALDLAGAFRNVGFAYLAGHGVGQELIDRTFAEAARFFALPREKKAEVPVEKSPCDRGWFDLGMENLDPDQQEEGDLKEGFRIGNDLAPDHPLVLQGLPFHGPNQWPAEPSGFREAMEEYFGAVHGLAGQVTHAVATALELPEDYFDAWFTTAMVIMSPLHYPPQKASRGRSTNRASALAPTPTTAAWRCSPRTTRVASRSATRPAAGSTPGRSPGRSW
ncbi:MAG TPA: 2-oxoglutarate and iron-dependent oxygenase domain-containing protein [Acidimicrobiales bacterium]|jgi:isopenicillin N synthase-like dioxygenase